ncbi:MAG TPA: hypothetical protein VM345_17020 [Acidimicrobiales bacterium]|nr:hypothetical protein [Acidimicrobiales bacterium]
MADLMLKLYIRATFTNRDDRGEGVVSAAIAVLIVAFLGVAVWAGFNSAVKTSSDRVNANVEKIGNAP